ncbi:DUF3515 domain-containing protein [Actinomycetospora lemnae]|uniref:DUF3515 domain-containing protein n=1 Tax=Actinomycetospora lemnae TaxID=3019891 RepID=A0ABT5SNJ1_9PSEU|nr:DUF3515 domain-containing protein [Actinomycetospora sp. DW7H6]MDD7964406.1 DUF3515 domain-containing protein [Actinomycetospora sp. DW7H6]
MVLRSAPEVARRLPRVLVVLVLTVPVLVVAGVFVASLVLVREPVPDADTVRLRVPAVPTPAAASADCSRLLSGLPGEMATEQGMLARRVLADPVPPATVAWGGEEGAAPVVLRCGLPRPAAMTAGGSMTVVNGVDWVEVDDGVPGSATWVTTDRAVYVGVTVPDGIGTAPIQDVSRGVKISLVSR